MSTAAENTSENTSEKAAGKQPERAYPAVLERKSARVGQMPLADIFEDLTIRSRIALANMEYGPMVPSETKNWQARMTPERKDAWSGIKELLSCDVGHHQLSFLMCSTKSVTSNWMHMRTLELCRLEYYIGEIMTIEIRSGNWTLDG